MLLNKLVVCKFYLTAHHQLTRVQSQTCTTYGKCLRERIMAVLTRKLGIDLKIYSILSFQKRIWKQFLHHILCIIFQEKDFSIFLSRYWVICALQFFVSQVVTSYILKLTLSFSSSRFSTLPKNQDKNLDILRTKRAFKVKYKSIFHHF